MIHAFFAAMLPSLQHTTTKPQHDGLKKPQHALGVALFGIMNVVLLQKHFFLGTKAVAP